MWLKQSTSTSFLVGPVLDASGLPVTTAGTSDFRISKAGTTAIFSGGTATHDTNGNYKITLTTGNTDTIGSLEIGMHNTSYAMSVHRFMVIEPSIFDDLVSTATNASGGLRDVARINGQTVNAAASVTFPASVADETTVASKASQASVDTLASYVDTEIAAIKAKTDNLPVDPADASDIAGSFATVNATLASISGYIDTEIAAIKAKTDNLPAQPAAVSDVPTANENASAVAAITAISRLDSMIESNGSGQFRFDTVAVSMVVGGGGAADWTADERTAIRAILGVPNSGTTPTDPTSGILDTIRDKTNLISTGTIQSALPVTASGQIEIPLIIGDDYLAANGRNFLWTVPLPTGFSIGSCTCRFGMENSGGTGEGFIVTGTVSDAGGGNASLSFDVPRATSSSLSQGLYDFSVELVSSGGNEVTQVASDDRRPVLWRKKQT